MGRTGLAGVGRTGLAGVGRTRNFRAGVGRTRNCRTGLSRENRELAGRWSGKDKELQERKKERKKEYLFIFLRHLQAHGIAIGTEFDVNTLVGGYVYC